MGEVKFTDAEKDFIEDTLAELDEYSMKVKLETREKLLRLQDSAEVFKNMGDENLAELHDKLSRISEKDFENMFLK